MRAATRESPKRKVRLNAPLRSFKTLHLHQRLLLVAEAGRSKPEHLR
jgi:hypothetical protein